MFRPLSRRWVLACAMLGGAVPPAAAQAPPLPPALVPVAGPTAVLGPPTGQPPLSPPATLLTPPPPLPPTDLVSPPVLAPEPWPDAPPDGPAGFVVAAELGLVVPHVKNRLTGAVPFPGFGDVTVLVPGAELNVTGAPRLELGYRMPEGFGEFLLSYRFLASDGDGAVRSFEGVGTASVRSRLDLNVFDLDYASREYSPAPHWDMKWRVGARLANVYYDSRELGVFGSQRVSNRFVGAGPHLGLDLWRHLFVPGLSLYFRGEGALAVGRTRQGYELVFGDIGGAASACETRAVPTLNVQLGLAWTPGGCGPSGLRFSGGYQYEHWWYLGFGDSRAELSDQGGFFRAEFNY